MLFPWLFIALGLYIGVTAARQLVHAAGSARWPSVEGRIVKSAVAVSDSGGDYPVPLYAPDIHYRYSLEGVSHIRQRVALADIHPGSEAKANATIRRYRPGTVVRVYVSPDNSEVTILEPGVRWPLVGKLLLGVMAIAAGLTLLVAFRGASN